jgi:sugar phosphate isomerase/epimerase
MMRIQGHQVGVCSWSIRPVDLADLAGKVVELGLSSVQLALGALIVLDDERKQQQLGILRQSGIEVSAGMIDFPGEDYTSIAMIRQAGGFAPDETWEVRRQMTIEAGKLAAGMGVGKLSCHIGFVPPSSAGHYEPMVRRVRDVAKELANLGVELLMETGQEGASELLQFLNDLGTKNVHINFDPANMILYGAGDPIEAIGTLGRHIRHVHVKDAVMSDAPGVKWGREVVFGKGQVGPERFLEALERIGYQGPLVIEREAGEDRMGDVREAIKVLEEVGVKV